MRLLIFSFALIFPVVCLGYGPFDYTNREHRIHKLPIVEQYHFNNDVENLVRGITSTFPGADLDYVLSTFPNHHRALNAMATLYRTKRNPVGIPAGRDAVYYFKQAMDFAPHDGVVPMLYGIHLHKLRNLDAALVQYQNAEKILPNYGEVHYNMGLLYFMKKDYALAKNHAEKAYKLGYPLPGLRIKLKNVGEWAETPVP